MLASGWTLAHNGRLWQHAAVGLRRSLGGLAIALLTAVPLPLLVKSARTMEVKDRQLFLEVILPASVPTSMARLAVTSPAESRSRTQNIESTRC